MNSNVPGRFTGMAVLRMAASAYLVYLGISLIKDHLTGKSTMAPWLSWGFGILFVLAGGFFGWYSWKRARKEAEIPPDEMEEPAGDTPEEDEPEMLPDHGPETDEPEETAEERRISS